jgi:hypothetical protein
MGKTDATRFSRFSVVVAMLMEFSIDEMTQIDFRE